MAGRRADHALTRTGFGVAAFYVGLVCLAIVSDIRGETSEKDLAGLERRR